MRKIVPNNKLDMQKNIWKRWRKSLVIKMSLALLFSLGVIRYFSYSPEKGYEFTWTPYVLLAIFFIIVIFKKFIIDKLFFRKED